MRERQLFRRKSDVAKTPERPHDSGAPLLGAMKRAVLRKPLPALFTRFIEAGREGALASAATAARAALFKEAEVTQNLIRLLAGETPLSLVEAYRYYFAAMVRPERLRAFRSARDNVLRGHISIDRRGGELRLLRGDAIIVPGEDGVLTAAMERNRVFYFAGRRVLSIDRKDLHGHVERENLGIVLPSSRLVVPLDDHYGLIEVVGDDLTFGSLLRRHEAAVEAALDLSKILSLKHAAEIDRLTGVYNRRAFDWLLRDSVEQYVREGSDLALVMFDIDNFKNVNDSYGHPTGDDVLAMCAATASATMRASDLVGRLARGNGDVVGNGQQITRYGGEEFALLLPDVDQVGAAIAARRCREAIASKNVRGPNGERVSVTVSMGIATLSEAEQAINAGVYPGPTATVVDEVADRVARISGAVKKMADDALYAAKNAGKNTVTLASVLRDGVAASIVFKKP